MQSLAPDAVLVNATFAGGHNNSGCFFSDALSRWVLAPARVARHGTPQLVEDEEPQPWAERGMKDTLS